MKIGASAAACSRLFIWFTCTAIATGSNMWVFMIDACQQYFECCAALDGLVTKHYLWIVVSAGVSLEIIQRSRQICLNIFLVLISKSFYKAGTGIIWPTICDSRAVTSSPNFWACWRSLGSIVGTATFCCTVCDTALVKPEIKLWLVHSTERERE